VLMGANLRPTDVDRMGITGLTGDEVRAAVAAGERIKLLCEAYRVGDEVRASVRPARLSLADPLSQVRETSSAVTFETDTLHELTLVEGNSDPTTTAYGMLVDMINIHRGRYR
jgi:homoserine dehydrogenase